MKGCEVMKKFVKVIAVLLLISAPFLYNNLLFDRQPFDDLKTGEIEKLYLFTDGKSEHHEVFDYSEFTDRVKDLELIKRTRTVNEEHQGTVCITIYYRDGSEERISVSPDYIQTDDGIYIGEREESVEFLKYVFRQTIFFDDMTGIADQQRMDEILMLAVNGKTWDEIIDYAKDKLLTGGFPDEILKSFANQGYSPIYIYVLDEDALFKLNNDIMNSVLKSQYKDIVEQAWRDYKHGDSDGDNVPPDYIFTETVDWKGIDFTQDEMGYYYAMIPSEDNRYNMCISVDDTVYVNIDGSVTDNPPFVRSVTFYKQ